MIKPNSPYVLKANDLEYRHKMSPYVGETIGAQIIETFVRGNSVYHIDKGVNPTPIGKFIKM